MKLGRVLTYKNVDEARRLIGKKVVASSTLYEAENDEDQYREALEHENICLLSKVVEGDPFPFRVSDGMIHQFIREVIDDETCKPRYEPYDLSDKKVRDSLRGKWFKNKHDTEEPVSNFCYFKNRSVWYVNGYSSKDFLENCTWLDGTPCGRRVDKEMSSPQY